MQATCSYVALSIELSSYKEGDLEGPKFSAERFKALCMSSWRFVAFVGRMTSVTCEKLIGTLNLT